MIFIYITCKNKKEAQKIAKTLVKEKLAACVGYFPIESIYRWKGKIVDDREFALLIKTLKKNFTKVEKHVKELHSYQIPCICAIPVYNMNKEYLGWVKMK